MIREMTGSIFDSGADVLVNPVNCVGVAGAGLAKAFRERFPENFAACKLACDRRELRPGGILLHDMGQGRWIANVATKDHWRNPSQLEWIDSGLKLVRSACLNLNIRSIAIPAIGCGLGGLPWADVRAMIDSHMGDLDGIDVMVYPPR